MLYVDQFHNNKFNDLSNYICCLKFLGYFIILCTRVPDVADVKQ
jgi:hypothetical protein